MVKKETYNAQANIQIRRHEHDFGILLILY